MKIETRDQNPIQHMTGTVLKNSGRVYGKVLASTGAVYKYHANNIKFQDGEQKSQALYYLREGAVLEFDADVLHEGTHAKNIIVKSMPAPPEPSGLPFGHWTPSNMGPRCSACGEFASDETTFCPHCGAPMSDYPPQTPVLKPIKDPETGDAFWTMSCENLKQGAQQYIRELNPETADALYKALWVKHIRDAIDGWLAASGQTLTDAQKDYAADRYVYGGECDLEQSYWYNIENVVNLAREFA